MPSCLNVKGDIFPLCLEALDSSGARSLDDLEFGGFDLGSLNHLKETSQAKERNDVRDTLLLICIYSYVILQNDMQ